VYYRIGSREAGSTSLLTVVHIMGSIFYSILAVTLLPFASLSLFIYDRQFYSGEAASKLYTSRLVSGLCCLASLVGGFEWTPFCVFGSACSACSVGGRGVVWVGGGRRASFTTTTTHHHHHHHHHHKNDNSAYFLANIVLETALNSFNGLLYSLIVYFNLDYATFTRPESVAANFGVRGCIYMYVCRADGFGACARLC
jgi:hypothetical protein